MQLLSFVNSVKRTDDNGASFTACLCHLISKRVFDVTRSEFLDSSKLDGPTAEDGMEAAELLNTENTTNMPFELSKTQTTAVVPREEFLNVVCDALTLYKYAGPNQRADLLLACRGNRLGITTVVSTDSVTIRHMMRSFVDGNQSPLLYASTYHAGDYLDPVAVAQAKAKRRAKKLAIISHSIANGDKDSGSSDEKCIDKSSDLPPRTEVASKKNLMALLNTDGSVAKAWPVVAGDSNGNINDGTCSEKSVGNPMYGPLQIGKAEPVNLQFGSFGISAWPSDTGCTSHAGSTDDSKADGTDTGSRYLSSCCSSPKMPDDNSKELLDEYLVFDSEEEGDDTGDAETNEDLTDEEKDIQEMEEAGSVEEHSTKSDEKYEDLDMGESGYWSDNEQQTLTKKHPTLVIGNAGGWWHEEG
ncbi:hypothetical protein ACQ4PT_018233 [Festuca glaucescens]